MILNNFSSFGGSTNLQLSIPISVFYRAYQETLYIMLSLSPCDHKALEERFNTPSSRKALKEHLD